MRIVPRAEQIEGSRQFSLRHPCGECPFSRQCTPGGTGGADPTVYVGQAQGSFWLPCHMDRDYNKESALDNAGMIAQCAGAAVYRANVGIDSRIPPALLHLPEDHGRVFSSPAELVAHHNRISVEEAQEIIDRTPPDALLMIELRKLQARNFFAVAS